jgi:hypothetical protein
MEGKLRGCKTASKAVSLIAQMLEQWKPIILLHVSLALHSLFLLAGRAQRKGRSLQI